MKNIETLENRILLSTYKNADNLFKKDVVHLKSNSTYYLNNTVHLKSNQKIIGNFKKPPTIILKKKNANVFFLKPDSHHTSVDNVILSSYKNMPAISIQGNNHTFSNVSITKNSGSAFIVGKSNKITIKDCNQTTYTQRGFIYGHNFYNLVVRNVTTAGNLYENEMRFHSFNGLALINVRIDAANPAANLGNSTGIKDNALRIHDGKNAYVKGLTVSGNVYFGVMDGNNGGLDDYKRRRMTEFKRKMSLKSHVVAENVRIYGNLVLGTNLTFILNNIGMVSWNRGTAISVNPKYSVGGMSRNPAKGVINGITVKFSKVPVIKKLNSLMKAFEKKVKIKHGGKLINSYSNIDITYATFNKIMWKK